jgi:hypothetical protein
MTYLEAHHSVAAEAQTGILLPQFSEPQAGGSHQGHFLSGRGVFRVDGSYVYSNEALGERVSIQKTLLRLKRPSEGLLGSCFAVARSFDVTVFSLDARICFGSLCGHAWQLCISNSSPFNHVAIAARMAPKSVSAKPAAASNAVQSLWKAYNDQTTDRLKFIDTFLFFLMLSGIAQFLYCVLVTDYPFNAFLAGCVG